MDKDILCDAHCLICYASRRGELLPRRGGLLYSIFPYGNLINEPGSKELLQNLQLLATSQCPEMSDSDKTILEVH